MYWFPKLVLTYVWTSKSLYFLQDWIQRHLLHDHSRHEVGRDLWRLSAPSPPYQVQPHRTVCLGPGQDMVFVSKAGDSTAFLGNPCQCWDTLTVMKCFLKFRQQLLCLGLCPLPLLLSCTPMERAWLTRSLLCKADF